MKHAILSIVVGVAIGAAFVFGFCMGLSARVDEKVEPSVGFDLYPYGYEQVAPQYDFESY